MKPRRAQGGPWTLLMPEMKKSGHREMQGMQPLMETIKNHTNTEIFGGDDLARDAVAAQGLQVMQNRRRRQTDPNPMREALMRKVLTLPFLR